MKSRPVFIPNHDFQTILIKVLFPFQETEKNLAKIQLLPALLNPMNASYPSEEELSIARKKLYILGSGCGQTSIGDAGCFSFSFIIPDTSSLGEDLLEEQMKFFHEVMYHPYLENGGFSNFELERRKKSLKVSLGNALKNIHSYQDIQIRKLMDDVGILSRDLIHHPELVDEVTPENLYEFYQEIILNNSPSIYIFGNVDSKKMEDLCDKYFYLKPFQDRTFDANLFCFLKPRKEVVEVVEESDFHDSSLSMVYKVKDMTIQDGILLDLIHGLLSSLSSRLLGKKLRNEKDLIYSSKVLSYPHYGALEITAFMQKEHYDEVKKGISEVLNSLKEEDSISEYLENLKERKRLNLIRKADDKFFLLEDSILVDLGADISSEEYYEKMLPITSHDIACFVDRLQLDTIYFIKEGDHE